MNDAAPTVLAYSSNPATYANGVTIAPNTPSNSGGAVIVYSVSPPLPAGLGLNAVTGVITGTPTAAVAAANYTVTAQNSGGTTTVVVNIRVLAPAVVTPNPTTTPVLSFNGTSRHVNAGTAIALANQSFTIEFWAKRGAIGALHTAINQGLTGAGTDKVLTIGFTAANTFSFGFSADDLVTTTTYTDTDWHHWACTFDASSRDRRIYLDGLLVKSGTATGKFQGSGSFIMGANSGGASSFFNGCLGDVRVWSAVRSAGQISAGMFNAPVGNEAGLAACWPLDDGTGTTAADNAVGHANPGTVTDAIGWLTATTSFGPVFMAVNGIFTDPGATAKDSLNNPLTVTAVNDVVPTTAGFYGVVYSATDSNGITKSVRRAVEVDDASAPPPPEVLSPANGGTVQTPATTISGIAEANSTVTLTITGAASSTETATTNGTGQFSTTALSLPDGVYQVSAVATNAVPKTSAAMPASTFTHGALPATQPGIAVGSGGFSNAGLGVNRVTTQTVTLTNATGIAIPGPVYLVLDSLIAGAPFLSARDSVTNIAWLTGTTTRTPQPTGSPYVQVVAPASSLAPGASLSVVLKFSNPIPVTISYTGRVLSGGTVTP